MQTTKCIGIYGKKQVGKTRVLSAILDIPYINKPTIDIHKHSFNSSLHLLDLPENLSKLHLYHTPSNPIDKIFIVLNGNYPLTPSDLEAIHVIRRHNISFELLICFNTQYLNDILKELPKDIPIHYLTNKREIKHFQKMLHKLYPDNNTRSEPICAQQTHHINSCTDSDESRDPPDIPDIIESIPIPTWTWTLIGKENAGKSTLFNTLLGYERNVVSDIPGTTQASVTETLSNTHNPHSANKLHSKLIKDTAGIKKFNNDHIYKLLEKNSIVLFLIDAITGLTVQDKKLLSRIEESGLGCLICLNKIDLLNEKIDPNHNTLTIHLKKCFAHIPIIPISAKSGFNLNTLLQYMSNLETRLSKKFPTRILNNWIHANKHTFHLIKIKYMRQTGLSPYGFTCFTCPAILTPSQKQYVRNLLYTHFSLEGICFQLNIRSARSAERAQQKPAKFKERGYYKRHLKS